MFLYLYMKSGSVVVLHVHIKTICQQFVILDNRSHRKRKKTSVYLFVKNLKILHHAHSSLSLTNRLHLNLFLKSFTLLPYGNPIFDFDQEKTIAIHLSRENII